MALADPPPVKVDPHHDCKVCTALDTLPDDQADELDHMLANKGWSRESIARAVTRAGQPVSRRSVSRHISGECALGLRYRAA